MRIWPDFRRNASDRTHRLSFSWAALHWQCAGSKVASSWHLMGRRHDILSNYGHGNVVSRTVPLGARCESGGLVVPMNSPAFRRQRVAGSSRRLRSGCARLRASVETARGIPYSQSTPVPATRFREHRQACPARGDPPKHHCGGTRPYAGGLGYKGSDNEKELLRKLRHRPPLRELTVLRKTSDPRRVI